MCTPRKKSAPGYPGTFREIPWQYAEKFLRVNEKILEIFLRKLPENWGFFGKFLENK